MIVRQGSFSLGCEFTQSWSDNSPCLILLSAVATSTDLNWSDSQYNAPTKQLHFNAVNYGINSTSLTNSSCSLALGEIWPFYILWTPDLFRQLEFVLFVRLPMPFRYYLVAIFCETPFDEQHYVDDLLTLRVRKHPLWDNPFIVHCIANHPNYRCSDLSTIYD